MIDGRTAPERRDRPAGPCLDHSRPSDRRATASDPERINHALEPALRAAALWRDAAADLEQLDRDHRRRRATIVARQERAGALLASFMAATGANRQWLTALLNLPDHAGADPRGEPDASA